MVKIEMKFPQEFNTVREIHHLNPGSILVSKMNVGIVLDILISLYSLFLKHRVVLPFPYKWIFRIIQTFDFIIQKFHLRIETI